MSPHCPVELWCSKASVSEKLIKQNKNPKPTYMGPFYRPKWPGNIFCFNFFAFLRQAQAFENSVYLFSKKYPTFVYVLHYNLAPTCPISLKFGVKLNYVVHKHMQKKVSQNVVTLLRNFSSKFWSSGATMGVRGLNEPLKRCKPNRVDELLILCKVEP